MRLLCLSGIAFAMATAVAADPFQQLQSSIAAQDGELTRLDGAGYRISVDELSIEAENIVLAGEALVLSGVTIRQSDNAAFIQVGQLTAGSVESLIGFGTLPFCRTAPTDALDMQLSARDIAFRSEGGGSVGVTESVSFDVLGLGFAQDREQGCVFPKQAAFEGMQARSADGATGQVESGAGLMSVTSETFEAAFELKNITSIDRKTASLIRIGATAVSVTGDPALAGGLDLIGEYQGLFDMLMTKNGSLDIAFSGILVEDMQGQSLPGAVNGETALQARLRDGDLTVFSAADLDGLLEGSANLELRIVEGGAMSGLSTMFGNRPEAAVADRVSFLGATADFKDTGIVALLAAAGYPKADIIAWLTRKLAPAPAVVADPVVAFFSDALDGAASVTAAPEGPVSAAAVIMAGVMNPASIGELMGLSRD